MRFILTLLCTGVLLTLLAFDQPQLMRAVAIRVGNSADAIWNRKEIWVSGAEVMSRSDIDALLPNSQSNWWWLTHQKEIEAQLRANPLILDARVSRCREGWWGCFNIAVTERRPELLLIVGERGWMIGQDGGVIAPLPQERTAKLIKKIGPAEIPGSNGEMVSVPVVEGLLATDESPDLVRARLAQARKALGEISDIVGLRVNRVSIQNRHDMRVYFEGRPFVVTFDSSPDGEWENRVIDEAKRLKELLAKLGDEALEVKEIDLAFDRMAVVRGGRSASINPEAGKQPKQVVGH